MLREWINVSEGNAADLWTEILPKAHLLRERRRFPHANTTAVAPCSPAQPAGCSA